MSSNQYPGHDHSGGIAQTHHLVTGDLQDSTSNNTPTSTYVQGQQASSAYYDNNNTTTTSNFNSTSNVNPSDDIASSTAPRDTRGSVHPATGLTSPLNPSTESEPLNSHTRPSVSGPDATGQGLEGDTTIRRASVAQNAPGKAGDVGEGVLGAVGFGGTRVERPKEDQGIGEKIVGFFGA